MNRKLLFLLATILILIGLIGSIFTINTSKEVITKNHTFPSSNIDGVEVSVSNMKVNVLPTTGEDILIELKGTKADNLETDFHAQVDDQTLKVNFNNNSKWKIFSIDFLFHSLELIIQLPEKQYEQLYVKSDNGLISVQDIQANDINLHTDNGLIKGEDLITATFHANTNNGKITMHHIEGAIQGQTDNGKISLATPDLEQSIHLETHNGKIAIHSEKEPENVTFITKVDNGTVNIFKKYDNNAVVGNGEHIVELKVGNGQINISH